MQPIYKNSAIFMGIIAASAALSACGGGSSSSDNAVSQTGRAVDFNLSGSTVTFADCGNKTTSTDANGNFNFPDGCLSSAITVTGGIDTGTNLKFQGELKNSAQPNSSSPAIASVFTTLVASGVDPAQLAAQLGLSGQNLLTLDPMTNKEALKANFLLQQLMDQVSSALASNAFANKVPLTAAQAQNAALKALSAQLVTSNTSSLASISNTANLTAIIQNAATNAGFSPAAAASVATNSATSITNSLATISTAIAGLTIVGSAQDIINSIGVANLSAIAKISNAANDVLKTIQTIALNNYLQLNSITLNNSGTATPIAGAGSIALTANGGLTDVQVALNSVGSPFTSGTSTVNAGLSYTIGTNTVNLIINNVNLTFNSVGALTGATVPVGSSYSYNLSGAVTAKGSATNITSDNLFKNGNLDLPITSFLSKIASASGQSAVAFTPKSGDKVTVALTIAPAGGNTSLTVGTGSGKSAIAAPSVSVTTDTSTLVGQGVNAQVNVN